MHLINLNGSYNRDTLGHISILLIFTPIYSYSLYMRYYEKWSEIARGDSTIFRGKSSYLVIIQFKCSLYRKWSWMIPSCPL